MAGENLAPSWIVESGGIRVGIFGLTVDSKKPEYAAGFADPVDTARRLTAELRAQGAEVVVGLTHLNAKDDRRLLATLGDAGPDVVVGGHDHEHMACDAGGRLVLKADADARTATVIELTLDADGKLAVGHRLEPIAEGLAEDCALAGRVDSWLALHEGYFCGQQGGGGGHRRRPRAASSSSSAAAARRLVAEESKIRGEETNLGDWVADRMVEAFAGCGAQVAFVNSGSLRLNQDIPAGPITRRTIEELFAYPAPLYLLRLKGSTLQQVAAHAVDGWPGAGNWLQVSGFAFEHDTANGRVSGVELVTADRPPAGAARRGGPRRRPPLPLRPHRRPRRLHHARSVAGGRRLCRQRPRPQVADRHPGAAGREQRHRARGRTAASAKSRPRRPATLRRNGRAVERSARPSRWGRRRAPL